jgi:hypothetical protein
LARKSKRKK